MAAKHALVLLYSGAYEVHMPVNGMNNISLRLMVRSTRLVVARTGTFTSCSEYESSCMEITTIGNAVCKCCANNPDCFEFQIQKWNEWKDGEVVDV